MSRSWLLPFLFVVSVAPAAAADPVDAAAAESLAKQSNCFKCHLIDRKKEGTPWREVAAKYRGKPDAEEKLMYHLTSGEIVKFADGHEEKHKIVKSKDPQQLNNLIAWILSL